MIDLEFVERLIRSIDESSIDSVEIERGGTRIRLSKSPPGGRGDVVGLHPGSSPHGALVPAAAASSNPHSTDVAPREPHAAPEDASPGEEARPAAPEEDLVEVTSPMVGTFFRAPSPGSDPFTEVGKAVSTGDTLCIIEAMKLMNELEAEVDGTVREVCVENGEPVEYGQVLFRIAPG